MSFPPKVRYHTTVYIEENQTVLEKSCRNCAVNDVIKVINGSLESILHLIGYSFTQIKEINRLLSIRYNTDNKNEFDLSFLEDQIPEEIKNERPSRAHVIEYENRLYGVIVDEGKARICGQIKTVVPKNITEDQNSILNRGFKVSKNSSERQPLNSEDEVKKHIQCGQHFVIVSEKGSAIVVHNDDPNKHQLENPLTLVLGNGFVIINDPSVHWIRSKQHLRGDIRESTELSSHESIIVSLAAITIGTDYIKVCGSGSVVNIRTLKEFYACL